MTGPRNWSRRRFLTTTGLAVGSGILLPGCSGIGFGDTLDRVREDRVVRIGYAGERPYAYDDNGLTGAIPAVHREVFRRIGDVELRGVRSSFRNLLEGLNAGRFDVVGAGMFIQGGRCERALFSAPVYCARSALLVREGNPQNLSDFASVASKGATLAVLGGAVEKDYARQSGVAEARLRFVPDQTAGLEAVATGDADAFALTSVSLRSLVETLRGQRPSGDTGARPGPAELVRRVELLDPFAPVIDGEEQIGCGGAAFRNSDEGLRDAFDEQLGALRREGRIVELMAPYGFTQAEMPEPGITTEQLCRTGGVSGAEIDPLPR